MRKIFTAILAAILLLPLFARADNWSANVGAGPFIGADGTYGGTYVYAGPSYTKQFEKFTWTSALTLEFSPHPVVGRLGAFAWSTIDVKLCDPMWVNTGLSIVTDQSWLDFGGASLYAGPIVGVTASNADGWFVAPSFATYRSFSDGTWWLYPMVTFGKGY